MERLKIVECGLAILALSLVLTVWITPVAAITGGDPDGDGHPNVGAIVAIHPEFGPSEICSGTLIHPRVFLTAGHCTGFISAILSADEVFVSFDPNNALEEGWLPVAAVITHPDYYWGPNSNPHDVGVLILQEPVGVTSAILPEEGFLDDLKADDKLRERGKGAKFTVVGYGATLEWPPPEMHAPDGIRRVAKSEFLNLRKVWLHMSQNQAPGKGDSGSCYGDSGGPVFWKEDGAETLVAITSWGDAPCVATGTTYRVDIPDTLDFISDITDITDIIGEVTPGAPRKPARRPTATLWGRIKSEF